MTTPLLRAQELVKSFGQTRPVVDKLSLELNPGQITCLLGPSGCGKTTTLRLIAGFEDLDGGEIQRAGQVISKPGYVLPPDKRRMGMVFQEYALFPHLTVAENIGFGLSSWTHQDQRKRIDELCALLGISDLCQRYPHQLSGGQQQRLALGRALAPNPELLLMDEPFANLDVGLRHDLRQEVFGLLRCTRIPVLLVTHDQEEALTVSDQLAVMRGGRIEQSGAPDKVYRNPTTRFVASFIGQASWVVGTRNEGGIVTELGRLKRSVITIENCVCDEVWVLLRPEDVALSNNGTGTPARVLSQSYHGTRRLHTLQLPSGTRIRASFNAEAKVRPGDMVPLRLVPKQVSLFAGPAEAGEVPNCCQTARAAQQQVNRVDSQILKKLV